MAYNLMKRVILRSGYGKNDVMNKLDAFLAADRITTAQYQELVELMNGGSANE